MTLKEKLQHRYALSEKGAQDMIRAFISVTISDIVLMLPVGMLYMLVKYYMADDLNSRGGFFAIGCIACLILIAVTTYIQYNATFLNTYIESGVRRTTLAERYHYLFLERKICQTLPVRLWQTVPPWRQHLHIGFRN